MNITWHGNSFFRITTQKDKNSLVEIVTNPFSKETGLKPAKLKADILLLTNKSFLDSSDNITGDFFEISIPGEYEVKDVFVHALANKNQDLIHIIESEDIRICFLGELKEKELTAEELETIGAVDILMIPVGGTSTINSKEASQIVAQVEPKIVIPMSYQIPGLKEKKEKINDFLKTMGVDLKESLAKFSIKKKDISTEQGVKIIVLDYK